MDKFQAFLMDFIKLDKPLAPMLLPILFWLGLAGIVLSGIGRMLGWGPMPANFVGGLLIIVLGGVFWRIYIEVLKAFFDIRADVREIKERKD